MSFTPFPKQTQVILLEGVPLTPDYANTTRYLTKAAQESDFMTYNHISIAPNSYQRSNKGTIRIAKQADEIYRYNYMMFKNQIPAAQFAPHYSDKWFYCFITDVEYINDNTCEITYEIDAYQTYMFDYTLGMNYIEREHSDTDAYGEHITDEDINVGDLLINNATEKVHDIYSSTDNWHIVFYYVANEEIISSAGQGAFPYPLNPNEPGTSTASSTDRSYMSHGTMVGLSWTYLVANFSTQAARETAQQNVSKIIATLISISANIVSIEIVPADIFVNTSLQEGVTFRDTQGASYIPKNKKLYSYPYRYIMVSNFQGDSSVYKWEDFKVSGWQNNSPMQAEFTFNRANLPQYAEYVRPLLGDYYKPAIENGVALQNTNLVTWSEDSYAQWWAQNGTSFTLGIISQAIGTVVTAMSVFAGAQNAGAMAAYAQTTGSEKAQVSAMKANSANNQRFAGGMANTINDVLNDISTLSVRKNTPDSLKGSLSQSTLINDMGKFGFVFYDMGVRARDAKIIDDYFSKYGYAVKRLKLPNIAIYGGAGVRPHWNYLKMKHCTLADAYMPAFAEEIICKIYNNGVTIWHNLSEVGNYSLDNSPPN